MLSKHPEKCRWPHGHTRTIEVVVSAAELDSRDMVVDFKALKLALGETVERYDHRMAINSADPLRSSIESIHPDSTIVYEGVDPTTEVMAQVLFEAIAGILDVGYQHETYAIPPGRVRLERVRVWETPTSWAEFAV